MLEIKNIGFQYEAGTPILKDLSVTFQPGVVTAIQGKSGEGKSTLLSILSGMEKNYDGEIILNGAVINKSELHKYSKEHISMIFQELNLIKYLNINDNIKQGCLVKGKKVDAKRMQDYIKNFDLETLNIKKYPGQLSGGQQQRIAIIRALLSDTEIILADEPTASIDAENAKIIMAELKQLALQENKIVIIVTHDDQAAQKCDQIYQLKNKTLVKKS